MISIIKRLFKKRPYTFLGRGGISFYNDEQEFYIDTNNFLGEGYDVEIFYKDIKPLNNDTVLSDSEKKRLAILVKETLMLDGIKADILPI